MTSTRCYFSPEQWAAQECQLLNPAHRWEQAELERQLMQFSGWSIQYDANGKTVEGLWKCWTFKHFAEVRAFVEHIFDVADEQDHHPDVQFTYNTVQVLWCTHSAHGISDNDWICAAKLDVQQQST